MNMEKINILCVDDQPEVLETITRDLQSLEKFFRIETADSVQDAKALLLELDGKSEKVGLVISDHVMPGDEVGVDLLRYVDTDVRFSKTRKILLTGQAGHADTIRAINEAHIDNYFDKPWKADELLLSAKKLLTQFILDCGLEYEDYMPLLDQEVLLKHLKRG